VPLNVIIGNVPVQTTQYGLPVAAHIVEQDDIALTELTSRAVITTQPGHISSDAHKL